MTLRKAGTGAVWRSFSTWFEGDADMRRHFTLSDEEVLSAKRRHYPLYQIGWALCLGALRRNFRSPDDLKPPPSQLVAYIAEQLDIDGHCFSYIDYRGKERRFREHVEECRQRLHLKPAGARILRRLERDLAKAAETFRHTDDLVFEFVEQLKLHGIIVPSNTMLMQIVSRAMKAGRERAYRRIGGDASSDQRDRLLALLELEEGEATTKWVWLRTPALSPAVRNFQGLLERIALIRALDIEDSAEPAQDLLADEALKMPVEHLRSTSPLRRDALLVAGVRHLRRLLADQALTMFEKILGGVMRDAKNTTEQQAIEEANDSRKAVGIVVSAMRTMMFAREQGLDPFAQVEQVMPLGRLEGALDRAERFGDPSSGDPLGLVIDKLRYFRRTSPAFLSTFDFDGAETAGDLLKAIGALKAAYAAGKRQLPATAPRRFIPKAWRRHVIAGGDCAFEAYEACALFELRGRLRAGDVWIEEGRRYRKFDDYLVPASEVAEIIATTPAISVSGSFENYIRPRREALSAAMERVGGLAAGGALEDASIIDGVLTISPVRASDASEADHLSRRLSAMLPRVRITEVLEEVDDWTGFSRAFVNQRNGRLAARRDILLTTILADGINLGLAKMAAACKTASFRQLAWMHNWHIREETYAAALATIIDAHRNLPLARIWGDGATSSSDGQFFRAGARGEAIGDINARYGSEPGVRFYTHITDQYGPFHSRVISATESEAPYVLDGLLRHESGLKIDEHYTDTGGCSDLVFGLCPFFAIRFAPRLRDIRDRRLHVFLDDAVPQALKPLIGGYIDEDLIAEHWDQLRRLAASIGSGHASAAEMLKKLSAYPRQSGLAKALIHLGRLERTLFILDWISNADLRQRTNAGLNKGESRNSLARAVFFNRLGELRDRSYENQAFRASGLNLVIAAIIDWNTVYLQRALAALEASGERFDPAVVRQLSPLGWEHINLTGDYIWNSEERPPAGEFRALMLPGLRLAA